MEVDKYRLKIAVAVLMILVFGVLGYFAINNIDNYGWITHHKDTPTYIDGEWLNGEVRPCVMVDSDALAKKYGGQESRGTRSDSQAPPLDCGKVIFNWPRLFSDTDHMHIMPGAFHGRVERSDQGIYYWRCQRNARGIECWALD